METIDYAEMLEIPVSTVNVVKKRKKGASAEKMKEKVLKAVNEKAEKPKLKRERGKWKASEITIVAEFVAACLLCTLIFLTNIFYEQSAMNTFSKGLFTVEQADKRTRSDFTLSGVVSERADVEIAVSSSGVLSFTADAAIYPVCDGTSRKITKEEEGSTVEIAHSDSFKSVIVGLSDVYAAEGDKVKGNLPVGYAKGDVRIMLYENGTLLNCFTVDENTLKWI